MLGDCAKDKKLYSDYHYHHYHYLIYQFGTEWHTQKAIGLYKVLTHSQGNLEVKGEPRANQYRTNKVQKY